MGGPIAYDNGTRWADATLIDELRALAESAGAEVVGEIVQHRDRPDKRYYIGAGKARELKHEVEITGAELVVIDNDLTPAQGKNLEDLVGVRVLDRSELILDIFAERARTREAKLQVELAQLQYLLPRLRRMWTHLSRIRGGIGLRGPGETQLEVDRRAIRQKIAALKRKLATIEQRRRIQRKGRHDTWNVALVGYTNVGKSTIMNRLAGEAVPAEDRLFATLDATTRRVSGLDDQDVVLTDTVGFIRNLPHDLVASFRATLEEVVHADLLLHVVDVSDPYYEEHMHVVDAVLSDLGVKDTPVLPVFNKFDRIPGGERAAVRSEVLDRFPGAVMASAIEPRGMAALEAALAERLQNRKMHVRVTVPIAETRAVARLHELADVVARDYGEDVVEIEIEARPEVVARIEREGFAVEELA